MATVTVSCPSCRRAFEIETQLLSHNEFPCPNCAAILTVSNKRQLQDKTGRLELAMIVLWPLSIVLLVAAALVFEASHDPLSFLLLVLGFIMGGISRIYLAKPRERGLSSASKEVRLAVARLTPSCGNCGSNMIIENAHFCARCGASLQTADQSLYPRVGSTEASRAPQLVSESVHIGACMICMKDIKAYDETAWCPHCGSLFHKTHLLEYLHVHNQCPACGNHLNEKELAQQLSQGPKQTGVKKR